MNHVPHAGLSLSNFNRTFVYQYTGVAHDIESQFKVRRNISLHSEECRLISALSCPMVLRANLWNKITPKKVKSTSNMRCKLWETLRQVEVVWKELLVNKVLRCQCYGQGPARQAPFGGRKTS